MCKRSAFVLDRYAFDIVEMLGDGAVAVLLASARGL
jgi:hypothetical protein